MNKDGYCLEFLENSGSIKLTDPNGRVIVEQYPAAEGLTFSQISSNADGISFLLTSDSLEKPLLCTYSLNIDKKCLSLKMSCDGEFCGELCYPPPYKNNPGELVLYPLQEGVAFYSEDNDVIPADIFSIIPTTRQKRCEKRLPLWPNGIIHDSKGG